MAIAFAMVVGAGLATTIGASFAFCAKITNTRMLAGSLGIAAGVMLYVSFVEIFAIKSVEYFEDEGYSGDEATRYATLCFFGGVIITAILDSIVHQITKSNWRQEKETNAVFSCDSVKQITPMKADGSSSDIETGAELELPGKDAKSHAVIKSVLSADHHHFHLQKLGLMSGLAIALHNFPEGLATFVAALADKTSGAGIAIAIAIHNIPEGVVVAMPVYYATKSRTKAFFWAFMSGVSEPIGGLLGWVVLSNMGAIIYAVMFGIVAGMMVYISFVDLIPTAFLFDPEDKCVTKSILVGMAVMASSLLLFAVG